MHSRIAGTAVAALGVFAVAASLAVTPLAAQVLPDTLSKAKRDSIAADSIRMVRELERMQAGSSGGSAQGPVNARLLPDISAVGDFVADLSPKGSTQEDRSKRVAIREVELAFQAAVDPYFRGDIFLGISDEEGIGIEQAFLTTTAFPKQVELKLGRFLMPVGKINLTHRHDLHTIEYPWLNQMLFGPEGLKGTGLAASRVFAPFGFFQEINLTAVDRFGEGPEDLQVAEPLNKELSGLTYSARLRNYWDISESTNFELAATALTSKREQSITPVDDVNAVGARQTLVGADVTFRWRPLQQGLYKSFIFQAEWMRQLNEKDPELPTSTSPVEFFGPTTDINAGYAFARTQITRRGFLGARYDFVESYDTAVEPDFHAASGYFEFFPSDFSKLLAGYERVLKGGGRGGFDADKVDRIILQASFSIGPHKPHPF